MAALALITLGAAAELRAQRPAPPARRFAPLVRGVGLRGPAPPAERAARALEVLRSRARPPLDDVVAAVRTVAHAVLAGRGEAYDRLREEVEALRAHHPPDFRRPLRPERDPLRALLVVIDQRRTLREPPQHLRAHESARTFPGSVPEEAPREAVEAQADLGAGGWISTGAWAPAGERVRVVRLEGDAPFSILIGCHTDDVSRRGAWKRMPRITRRYPCEGSGPFEVASAFGGLLYVVDPGKARAQLRVRLEGVVRAPRFVHGRTDPSEWKERIRAFPAPFGELAGEAIVLTLPREVLRGLDDPSTVVEFWDRVVRAQDELACYRRDRPERFVFDRQISAGYMHAGYPLMGPVGAASKAVDLETLRAKGNWGMFHEIGHNHQTARFRRYRNPWTFDGNTEVTCNVFAAYTYVAVLGRPQAMGHQHWRPDLLERSLAGAFQPGPYAEKSHQGRCLFFVHLVREFGWQALRAMFAAYAALPERAWPRTDLEKRSLMLEILSRQQRYDLGPFFSSWGLETSPAARAEAARFAPFEPTVAVPGG